MPNSNINSVTKLKLRWLKLTHFEFWPYWIFYLPFIPYYIFKSIQYRSFCLFTNINPSIYLSGIVGESKEEILSMIEPIHLPRTEYYIIDEGNIEEVVHHINQHFTLPIILKPDVGERGNLVEKISNENELQNYLNAARGKYIAQEFITSPYEFGIMYYHIPDTEEFKITSIVQKGFLHVVGDGKSSIKTLLEKQYRALLVWDYLQSHLKDVWNNIPKIGEKIYPQPIGNHCKGTMFIDSNDLITAELTHKVHSIAKNIPEFYYGRFDVKANTLEEFKKGEGIKIMELNGVTSEPGHIYDPNFRLLDAYRDLIKHFKIIIRISNKNKARGFKPASFREVYQLLSNFYSKA